MKPKITAEQFEREYAARCAKTVEELRKRRTVRPCNCGDEICEGWQSVSHAVAAELDAEAAQHNQDPQQGEGK